MLQSYEALLLLGEVAMHDEGGWKGKKGLILKNDKHQIYCFKIFQTMRA
jgi:hypothetical protein